MNKDDMIALLTGELLEDQVELSLEELCRACRIPTERVIELVDYGVIEPSGRDPVGWRFQSITVRRVRCAQRLEQDLGVNTAGAALALELLEEMEQLRNRLRRMGER